MALPLLFTALCLLATSASAQTATNASAAQTTSYEITYLFSTTNPPSTPTKYSVGLQVTLGPPIKLALVNDYSDTTAIPTFVANALNFVQTVGLTGTQIASAIIGIDYTALKLLGEVTSTAATPVGAPKPPPSPPPSPPPPGPSFDQAIVLLTVGVNQLQPSGPIFVSVDSTAAFLDFIVGGKSTQVANPVTNVTVARF
jgi:hypothetical protein